MKYLTEANYSFSISSDRTIAEYAKDIWGLEAVTVELQGKKVR